MRDDNVVFDSKQQKDDFTRLKNKLEAISSKEAAATKLLSDDVKSNTNEGITMLMAACQQANIKYIDHYSAEAALEVN